jgi:hypothetical protein
MVGISTRIGRSAGGRLGGLVTAAVCATAAALCLLAPAVPANELADGIGAEIGRSIARAEPTMRKSAAREFPGDLWSQGDAYFFLESRRVRVIAAQKRAAIGSVLQALDDFLRDHPGRANRGGVPACKPRPFYD